MLVVLDISKMHFSFRLDVQLILFFLLCFPTIHLFGQSKPDSIPTGIIHIKRPPIPASYKVRLNYFETETGQSSSHITEFSAKQIVFGDSGIMFRPPQPSLSDKNFSDTIFNKAKTTKGFLLLDTTDRYYFAWERYLNLISWKFAWTDSSRMDSAQYEFTIDKKGKATCKALPWNNSDSTCRAFEKKTIPYLFLLDKWVPARRSKTGFLRRERKSKTIPCTVIVTVFAYDENERDLLPINVIEK